MKGKDKFDDPADLVDFDLENFDNQGVEKDIGEANPEKESL